MGLVVLEVGRETDNRGYLRTANFMPVYMGGRTLVAMPLSLRSTTTANFELLAPRSLEDGRTTAYYSRNAGRIRADSMECKRNPKCAPQAAVATKLRCCKV